MSIEKVAALSHSLTKNWKTYTDSEVQINVEGLYNILCVTAFEGVYNILCYNLIVIETFDRFVSFKSVRF